MPMSGKEQGEDPYIPEVPSDEWFSPGEYRSFFRLSRGSNEHFPFERSDLTIRVQELGDFEIGAWWSEQWIAGRIIRPESFAVLYRHPIKHFNVVNASNIPNHQRFEETRLFELLANAKSAHLKGKRVPWTYAVRFPGGQFLEMDFTTEDDHQMPSVESYHSPDYRLQWDELPGIHVSMLRAAYTTDPYLSDLEVRINTEPMLK